MRSIVQEETDRCFLCGKNGFYDRLEKHHIFGAYNRQKSEKDGLFVFLCGDSCHRNGKGAVHKNKDVMDAMHEIGQKAWERTYGTRQQFVERYHKNYIK